MTIPPPCFHENTEARGDRLDQHQQPAGQASVPVRPHAVPHTGDPSQRIKGQLLGPWWPVRQSPTTAAKSLHSMKTVLQQSTH